LTVGLSNGQEGNQWLLKNKLNSLIPELKIKSMRCQLRKYELQQSNDENQMKQGIFYTLENARNVKLCVLQMMLT